MCGYLGETKMAKTAKTAVTAKTAKTVKAAPAKRATKQTVKVAKTVKATPAKRAKTEPAAQVDYVTKEDARKTADFVIAHLVGLTDRIRKQLDGIANALAQPSQSGVQRELACVRSDTLALLAMREGDGRRLSRLEAMLQELAARPLSSPPPGNWLETMLEELAARLLTGANGAGIGPARRRGSDGHGPA
jgi:hypothetical protein